jgi:hypothetical protein
VAAQSVNDVRRLSTTKHDAEANNKVAWVGVQQERLNGKERFRQGAEWSAESAMVQN